jgi:hypothetical protein
MRGKRNKIMVYTRWQIEDHFACSIAVWNDFSTLKANKLIDQGMHGLVDCLLDAKS